MRAIIAILSFVVVPMIASFSAAEAQVIDFENRPPGVRIDADYSARGVVFSRAYLDSDAHAHSGTKVLRAISPADEVFEAIPLRMTFTGPTSRVAFFAGNFTGVTGAGTLKVFDANGMLLAQDGPKPVPNNAFTAFFEARVPSKRISRAEFHIANAALVSIDDLIVEGTIGSLPTAPPAVTISSPSDGIILREGPVPIRGTVTGDSLLDPVRLRIQRGLPPDSSAPPIQNDLSLSGSGTTHTFSLDYPLLVGPYAITATAKNLANLEGSASLDFTVLPEAIETRYNASGAAAAFGALRFGAHDSDCVIAIFENGLIAASGDQTFIVQGPIFTKWMTTRQQGAPLSIVGCPIAEERDALADARAQDFRTGRIYAGPPGTFVVPPAFVAAIDVLGGEAGVGLPTSDAGSDSSSTYQTWLFQRFRRSGLNLDSTLEIRGTPPRLYVERQAGSGAQFEGVVGPRNATIVDAFDCAQTLGPCAVAAPLDEPLREDTASFCNNKEFNWADLVSGGFSSADPDPPEWVPIVGHYVQTPIWGALFDVHLANGDNPFAHESSFEPCPTPTLEALVNEKICPSDWDLKIRPLPGYRSLQPVGRNAVQIEFERVDFQAHLVGYGDPTVGDLIFASGRYIVDCGHGPKFKTEIHPPSVYAAVRSVDYNGRPATEADIWVNRFFAGGDATADAIEFDIYPPPRPSPQAIMGASTPGNQSGAVNVTFRATGPYGPFRVRVTATRGEPEVTKFGELKKRKDNVMFGFDGRLRVYWNCESGPCGN